MEYLCHKWPRKCSVCPNHNRILSSFMAYHRVYNNSNTTSVTRGAGTAYPSGAPEFILGFKFRSCCSIFGFLCNVLWIIVLSLCPFSFGHCIVCPLSLMASDYHFGILLKLFFSLCPFFAWSLYCRSFFDLRPLIAAFGMFKHFFAALSKLTFEKPRLYLLDV